jgi:hypothetical protein
MDQFDANYGIPKNVEIFKKPFLKMFSLWKYFSLWKINLMEYSGTYHLPKWNPQN